LHLPHLSRERTPVASVNDREASKHVNERVALPQYYFIDESDPDILMLHRQDGTFVAAFSASGATREGIVAGLPEEPVSD
jgi:hypothetical protein